MAKNNPIKILINSCCALGLLLGPSLVQASVLLELIEVLHENGTINEQAYQALKKAAEEEKQQQHSGPAVRPAPATEPTTKPSLPKAVTMQADEGKAKTKKPVEVKFGGRIHVDAASYHNKDGADFGSGAEMRRMRVKMFGTAYDDWAFRTSVEFTGDVDLKTTYLEYRGWERNALLFGKIKEPIALEELNSSNYTTFMERAMLTELHPGRNVGPAWTYLNSPVRVRVGVFAQDVDSEVDSDDAVAIGARAIYAPVRDKRHALHLGFAANYRDMPRAAELRFRARPESHVTDLRLVDTGTIDNVESQTMLGTEAAWVHGPLSLQAEYLQTVLERTNGPDLKFGGWYAYLSWFVTGESRRYRTRRGTFGRVTPHRRVGAGGPGAWEVALRYSRLDLSDEDVVGGIEENLTFGVNWYVNRYVRFMFNYVKVLELDRPGSEFDGVEPNIFQFRSQINF